jgi:hypothetical protein
MFSDSDNGLNPNQYKERSLDRTQDHRISYTERTKQH